MTIQFNPIPEKCEAIVAIGHKEIKWQAEIYATGEVILISPIGTRYDSAKALKLAGVDWFELINHHEINVLEAAQDEKLEKGS